MLTSIPTVVMINRNARKPPGKSSIWFFNWARWISTVRNATDLSWTRNEGSSLYLGFMTTSLCSHMSAVKLFTDTVRNECPYLAYTCANFDDFDAGKCSLQCNTRDRQCNRMGYWASTTGGKGDLYLKTQDADAFPFCSKQRHSSRLSHLADL